MSLPKIATATGILLSATAAWAEPPRVVVDILPVHALVSQVMAGVAEPDLILPPTASPHGFSMRPSQARAIESANLVIWVGPELTPWMEKPLDALAADASQLALLDAVGTVQMEVRDLAVFAKHDDDDHDDHDDHEEHADHDDHDDHEKHADHDDHDDHEEHAEHDDHDDHEEHADHDDHDDHEEHADHDDHDEDEDHAGHDHHDHDGTDPHAWLDPVNGQVWLGMIALKLATIDPENAATYTANAAAASAELGTLIDSISAKLEPVEDQPFLVYHDAYQYFETRFHLAALGAVASSDATSPSPARLAELRDEIAEQDITCIFSEPQFSPRLVNALQDGSDLRSAILDPVGFDVTPGPDAYSQLLTGLADNITTCLGGDAS